jgi:2-oxo-3-hexenedioate decarboxylase
VARALQWAALGFELAQCRYPGWAFAAGDAVADGGLHGLLVVGDRVELDADRAASLAKLEVDICCDGEAIAAGRTADVLGGPLEAMDWLLRLPGVGPLPADTVVTTGSITTPMPVEPGQTWRVTARGPVELDPLEVAIGDGTGAPIQSPS